MGVGRSSNQRRSYSSKALRKLHQEVHGAVIQVLWMRQHSPLHKKLSFNIAREICSYLAGDYRKLVLVLHSEVKYFDIDRKKWKRLWKMRSNLDMEKFVWTLVDDCKIFVCGGIHPTILESDDSGVRRAGYVCIVHLGKEAFMLKDDGRVYTLTNMRVPRYKHAALYHAGEVYIFGGVDKLVETYSHCTRIVYGFGGEAELVDTYSHFARIVYVFGEVDQLGEAHDSRAGVVQGFGGVDKYGEADIFQAGEVSVYGGNNNLMKVHILRSCEKYSVSTNQWQDLPDMCEPRCDFSPCWYLSVAYLCGGWRRSVERFDPASNTFTLLPDLILPEGGWCIAVVTSDEELVAVTRHSISKMQQWRFESKRHTPYREYTECPPLVHRELAYVVRIGSKSEMKKSSSVRSGRFVYTCYGISLDTGEPTFLD